MIDKPTVLVYLLYVDLKHGKYDMSNVETSLTDVL